MTRRGEHARLRVRTRLACSVLIAAICGAAAPSLAAGSLQLGNFTSSRSDCGNQVDPINTVFRGQWADWGTVDNIIVNVVGWPDSPGSPPYFFDGSKQWIPNHGQCTLMNSSRSLGFFNRHHIRLFQNGLGQYPTDRGADGNLYVYGDAHRDVKHLLRDLIEPSKSAASADFH